MPANKRKVDTYDKSDPFLASDDETISKTRPSKKTKNQNGFVSASAIKSSSQAPDMKTDEEGNKYWEISKARRVTISDFKGKKMVSIREYYEKDGKQLPGKKGITMTIDQYSTFISLLPEIEEILVADGESIPRPQYLGGAVKKNRDDDQDEDDNDDHEESDGGKANFEATSDEE